MKTIRLEIAITLNRRTSRLAGAAALMLALPTALGSESFEMTTTYPAPAGVYQNLTATRGADLARDGGDVLLVRGGGGVAIGTTDPGAAKLAVIGGSVGIGVTLPAAHPSGIKEGLADVHDLYVREKSEWLSKLTFRGDIFRKGTGQLSGDEVVDLGAHKFCALTGIMPLGPGPNCSCDVVRTGGVWRLSLEVREGFGSCACTASCID